MTHDSMRRQSLKTAVALGFPTNPHLPLLETIGKLRSKDEVVDRLLCLYVVCACAYGFDRSKARAWLEGEQLWAKSTKAERAYFETGPDKPYRFASVVEALWALVWALGLVDKLDFSAECGDNLVTILPDIKHGEGGSAFRSKAKLRSLHEIEEACDLAYCLQWAVRDAQYKNAKVPGTAPEYVIPVRRHALQWLIVDDPWDEVTTDT